MVCAWHPTGVFSLHPGPPDQHILDGVVQHVAHVEHPGDIGGRDDHRIRLPIVGDRMKVSSLQPVGVPLVFSLCRVVLCRNVHVAVQSVGEQKYPSFNDKATLLGGFVNVGWRGKLIACLRSALRQQAA